MLQAGKPFGAVAHGGNHASPLNGGNLRTGLAPQDRAASPTHCLVHRRLSIFICG
ncbi:MAG: hypothetical protein KME31_36345 [Tolypothrix carrinoi HA7290-LM1]|nr:hypothetical protein [Tolypothrix carrinoi HA7290-LM1]